MSKRATTETPAEHWAATVARTVADVVRAEIEQRSAESSEQVTLKATVARELDAWLDQLTAATVDAAAAFNAELSAPAVKAARDVRGVLSVIAPHAALRTYLLIALDAGDEYPHGLMVTTHLPRGRTVDSFPFAVGADRQLVLELAGEHHGPTSVARVLIEPWLRALPLPKRGSHA